MHSARSTCSLFNLLRSVASQASPCLRSNSPLHNAPANDFFFSFVSLYEKDRRGSINSMEQRVEEQHWNACSHVSLAFPHVRPQPIYGIWVRKACQRFTTLAALYRLRTVLFSYSKLRKKSIHHCQLHAHEVSLSIAHYAGLSSPVSNTSFFQI